MKNKKILIIIAIIIITILLIVQGVFYFIKKEEDLAKQALTDFAELINKKEYEQMYEKLTEEAKSLTDKETFIKRNQNIYEGIDATDIKIEIQECKKEEKEYHITYQEKMYTSAGEVEFTNTAIIKKEDKENKINWSSKFIFPELGENDKVRIETIKAKRGEILDRNGSALAEDGKIASVGIVPGKLGENREENIQKISELVGVSVEYINGQLGKSYVKDDTFVPVKKISDTNTELKDKLLQIPGILINKVDGRVYPLGLETAHLIGYVQSVSKEDLEKNEGKGYNTNSVIGKSGLELAYEQTLRGIDGTEIYIEDENKNRKVDLIKQDKKDGEDVKLTIDSNLQTKIYEQMKDDKGFFVVMDPKTGELLALVSTPTFDSNDFVVGLTNSQWEELNNDENKPLYSRFTQKYCPGSTFKPITGAIGLSTNKINASEDFGYSGTSWQKDSSWGNYKITTLTAYNGSKNLLNGMIHSDNIYFAQTAMKIGETTFVENLNKIGFNEQLEFPISLAKSQYANNNETKITGETKLADTGYGQGSLLVNPIHMASVYSAFSNNGNMIKPIIKYDDEKGIAWKESAFTEEAADTIKDTLIQVVENKEGNANDMKISGLTIAGKTGTAELKTSSEDTESGTLGWFDCFTVNKADGNDWLIISMVENTQNNADGGSHYLINKIRTLF